MRTRKLIGGATRVLAVVFETGDEVTSGLLEVARREDLDGAHFTGIGAFRDVVLGFYDLDRQDYHRTPVPEQVEVVSLVGDITSRDDDRMVHAHVVVARRDGQALGGHLLEAHVRPTLEIMITETPAQLRRTYDPGTGLALIDLGETRDS